MITPAQANAGAAATGSIGGTRQFGVTNITSQPLDLTLSAPRQFPVTSTDCATLAPGATCAVSVELAPAINGALTGTLAVTGTTPGGSTIQSLAYLLGYGQGSGALTILGGSSPLNFGDATSGQSAQQTLTLTNSGTGPLTIHRITSQPPFWSTSTCGAALAASASCSVTLTHAPIDEIASGTSGAVRQDTGNLTIESDAITSPDVVALAGTATPVAAAQPASSSVLARYTLSSSALTFGTTQIGDISSAQTLTLTNSGTSTIHIAGVLAPQDFTASSSCTTLLPAAACTIEVEFTPGDLNAQSQRTGTLEIQSDAADSLEFVTLLGSTTAAPLTLTPTSLDFGTVAVGQSAQLSVTATNTGTSPITFGAFTASGPYTVTNGTCPVSGGTLAAGAQCSFTVTFTPTADAAQPGLVSLASSATQMPLTVALTGTGDGSTATPPPPTFALTVNGGSSASVSVASGRPAAFSLSLTPANGFSGPVALTCAPIGSAPYASCSLLASTLTLGSTAETSTATINTLTSSPEASLRLASILVLPLLTLLAATLSRKRRGLASITLAVLIGVVALSVSGCGSGSAPSQTSASNLLYTPAGTYQWNVSASSTSGPAISSSVVLTVTVQ
ncbi:MAG TPA: choice-of-anchor D domain-containing protein [Acidobacteriaceae bacterium]